MAKRIGINQRLKKSEKKQNARKKLKSIRSRFVAFIKLAFLTIGIALLGFFGAKYAAKNTDNIDFLVVKNINVHGIEKLDTSLVLSLASIEPGISMINLDISEIRKRLKQNPWIAKAGIRRKIPNSLVIAITEREPSALINLGTLYLVDRSGFIWSLKSNTYWNLPLVSGLSDTLTEDGIHKLTEDALSKMNNFFESLPKKGKSSICNVSQLDFSEKDIIRVKIVSSPVVVDISRTHVKKSMGYLCRIMGILEKNSKTTPQRINLCYNNIAFVM